MMINVPDGSIEVDNPAEILRTERGIFEVTSPYGHVFRVTCRRGRKMDVHDISEPPQVDIPAGMLWRIRRLTQAVT
jgi:hypothetical protein